MTSNILESIEKDVLKDIEPFDVEGYHAPGLMEDWEAAVLRKTKRGK